LALIEAFLKVLESFLIDIKGLFMSIDGLSSLFNLDLQVNELRVKVLKLGGIVSGGIIGGFLGRGLMLQVSLFQLAESRIMLVQFGVSIIKDLI
jgi:hypothetical protein